MKKHLVPYLAFVAALVAGWVIGGLTAPACPACPEPVVCPEPQGVNQIDPLAPVSAPAPAPAPAVEGK